MRSNLLRMLGLGALLALLTMVITVKLRPQTPRTAFTAAQTYSFYTGGALAKTIDRTMAVREDGSNAELLRMSGGQLTTFFDAGSRRVISADPKLKLASVRPSGQQEALRYLAAYPDCMSKYGSGDMQAKCTSTDERILGYEVVAVIRSPRSDLASEFRYWAAPALNYFPLREQKYKNSEMLEKIETVSLAVGPPAATLFTVPDDFKMTTRADYYSAFQNAAGLATDQKMLDFYRKDGAGGPISLERPRLGQ